MHGDGKTDHTNADQKAKGGVGEDDEGEGVVAFHDLLEY